jgi:hypothetical protein
MKQLTILVLIFLASCNSEPIAERFDVFGYFIGDTVDNGITITSSGGGDDWDGFGVINEYPKARVLIFNNHIDIIVIDSLTPKENHSLRHKISGIYDETPYYWADTSDSRYGSNVESFEWWDTISRDQIKIRRDLLNNPDSISTLMIENRYFSITYRDSILGPIVYDFTEMSDKE